MLQDPHVEVGRPGARTAQSAHGPDHAGTGQRASARDVLRRGQVGVRREYVRHRNGFASREIGVRQANRHRNAAVVAGNTRWHDLGDRCRGWVDHPRQTHTDRARERRTAGILIIGPEVKVKLVGGNRAAARVDPERHRCRRAGRQRVKVENVANHVVACQRPARRHDRRARHVVRRAHLGAGGIRDIQRHLGARAIVHQNGRGIHCVGNAREAVEKTNARRGRLVLQRGVFANLIGQHLQVLATPLGIGLVEQPLACHHLRRHHNVHISARRQASQCRDHRGVPHRIGDSCIGWCGVKAGESEPGAQPVRRNNILCRAKAFVGNPHRPHHFIPLPRFLHDRGLGDHQVRDVHRQKCRPRGIGGGADGLLKARPRKQLA